MYYKKGKNIWKEKYVMVKVPCKKEKKENEGEICFGLHTVGILSKGKARIRGRSTVCYGLGALYQKEN